MSANKSSFSKTDTLKKKGEFWDKHDFIDYDDSNAPDSEFDVTITIPIELDLLSALEEQANLRGVSVETLVNLWLGQKVAEQKV
jgi:hypothetical protein